MALVRHRCAYHAICQVKYNGKLVDGGWTCQNRINAAVKPLGHLLWFSWLAVCRHNLRRLLGAQANCSTNALLLERNFLRSVSDGDNNAQLKAVILVASQGLPVHGLGNPARANAQLCGEKNDLLAIVADEFTGNCVFTITCYVVVNGTDNRPVLHVNGSAVLKVRTLDGKDCGVIRRYLCHLGICDVNGFLELRKFLLLNRLLVVRAQGNALVHGFFYVHLGPSWSKVRAESQIA